MDVPPSPLLPEEFCWLPSHACFEELALIEPGQANVTMRATLTKTNRANNFGLFLYQGGVIVTVDAGPVVDRTDIELEHRFKVEGSYRLVVDPHWAAADELDLIATFSWA